MDKGSNRLVFLHEIKIFIRVSFPRKIMTFSTDFAISNRMSSFVHKYSLAKLENSQVVIFNEFLRQGRTTKVYIPVHS